MGLIIGQLLRLADMNFFNVDGFFNKLLSKLTDLLVLTILWIICSLPIFTIGAATTAAYTITLKMVKNEESYIFRSFFKAFKDNFKKATVIWLIYFMFGLLWGYIFYLYFYGMPDVLPVILIGVLFLAAVIYLMSFLYVFPLTARYENTIKQTMKNSILIAFRYLFRTLQMFIVAAILMAIGIWNLYAVLFVILIGAGIIMFILSYFYRVVFDHLEANFDKERAEYLKGSTGRGMEDESAEDAGDESDNGADYDESANGAD